MFVCENCEEPITYKTLRDHPICKNCINRYNLIPCPTKDCDNIISLDTININNSCESCYNYFCNNCCIIYKNVTYCKNCYYMKDQIISDPY